MFCPNCGVEERQPTQFCRACGADMRVIRTALQSPPSVVAAETARLEIARAIALKISALDPNDRRLANKIAVIRAEAEKMLETSEERLRTQLTIALAGLGGGALFISGMLLKALQSSNHDSSALKAFMAFSFFLTMVALLLTHLLPKFKRASSAHAPAEFHLAPVQATTGLAAEEIRMMPPPSVTETTTHQLSKDAIPMARNFERNTR